MSMHNNSRKRATHVAVIHKQYLEPILTGEKGVEARFSKTAVAPFGRVHRGDRIYLKEASGPFRGVARAGRVLSLGDLSEEEVEALRKQYNEQMLGPDDYWDDKRASRYATLVWLRRVEEVDEAPEGYVPKPRAAWHVIDGDE